MRIVRKSIIFFHPGVTKGFGMDYMNPELRKIIEAHVGMVTFIIILRLFLVPTYAFIHSGSEPLMIMLIILEAVLSVFIAYKVLRYFHRHL